jgi:hypothetical protein
MPLNISVEAEHPDVTVLKAKVREVAKRYTKKHGWCAEVNKALREAGIEDDAKVKVEIKFTVSGSAEQTATQTFAASALAGKTAEEQNAWVADQIAPKVVVAGVEVTLPVTVIDLTLVEEIKPVPAAGYKDGMDYPDGYVHFYTSNEGRVAHLVRKDSVLDTDLAVAGSGPGHAVSVINAWLRQRRIRALCGTEPSYYGQATASSVRAEGRVCQNCQSRV